jgi:hypothetical protein
MKIDQYRYLYNNNTTIGKLYINGEFFCYTLEDTVRGEGIKVHSHTAIPQNLNGYEVSIRYSFGFKRDMLILHTGDKEKLSYGGISFLYIYAHGGNRHQDTEGCILVAANVNEKSFTIQGTMENKLKEIVTAELDKGEIVKWFITNKSQLG